MHQLTKTTLRPEQDLRHTLMIRRTTKEPRVETREHCLVVLEGASAGQRIWLNETNIRIGRSAPCELVLQDSEMSRAHCRIERSDGLSFVVDLDSTNGTFVEGKRISCATWLPVNGLLQIGKHVLRHEFRERKEFEEAEAQEKDLKKAGEYVRSLLPRPWSNGPVTTEWVMLPSAKVGGDAFGYHALDEYRYAIYLIDVSGHGAGAAMHTVSVMNVLRHHALANVDFGVPEQVLSGLNSMFDMDNHGGMYFTIWYGVYDERHRTLIFSSGGHHPAFLVSADKQKAIPAHTRNVAVGTFPNYSFKSDEVVVPVGSSLYLFSDGAYEITTTDGVDWTLQEFVPFMQKPARPGSSEPQRLLDAVKKMARSSYLDDDFTMLVAKFH